MYNGYLGVTGMAGGMSFFLVIMLWSLFWKGLALWHSSRRGEYWWFLILLVVNTVGILELVYLFAIAKLRFDSLFTLDGKPVGHTHEHAADAKADAPHSH